MNKSQEPQKQPENQDEGKVFRVEIRGEADPIVVRLVEEVKAEVDQLRQSIIRDENRVKTAIGYIEEVLAMWQKDREIGLLTNDRRWAFDKLSFALSNLRGIHG